ncbi:metal ABC transporter substrate-binding protein [Fibrobacter sp.]|uniref:metal ABC transporter substrate-binding protein n=1 Tax=Fibrobacter sp. TaxID=35828 RepID=UPI0025C05854|nr:metal ABC transporter substrate-binding protein [Fibrobacter sp.]MBS7272751.1 zinc ABC transporter substrate-binding protein [Fibrobacter sp.]MCI6438150.1 metal ABC transporter substrate-binding protein [Fibrobacter sp.]MDD7497311.1 metal ABC transporter substrate-binding protein [Fibrobacter sp.]MDY5723280.1 metal ABC transporter substrate-binding protein [Fibrobacter sp.]
MKKIAFIASIFALLTLFIACNSDSEKKNSEQAANNGKKISVVATIYPQYAWLKEILGNQADSLNLTLLVKNGMDLHSYKPSAADIATIAKADMIVYVGGESDKWIEKALEATPNEKRVQVNLLEALGDRVKAEEIVEGMQAEEEHEHHHEHAEEHEDEHHHHEEAENDEHIWLSLKNAELLVMNLADALSKADTTHATEYHMNAALYIAKISALDAQYRAATDSAHFKTILFGDRFPFRYLVDDYGIKYFAAFVGCSAESEASFETVAFLAGKMDSLALPAIFTIDGSNGKIARAILDASKKSKETPVLTLNSMQSIKNSQMDSAKYLDIMRENLEVIKKALK